MPEPDLIADYLSTLVGRLPAAVVAQLADGLLETYEHHRSRGRPIDDAAAMSVAEFGDPTTVLAAFLVASPARRAGRFLLFTGPLIGGAWADVFLAQRAWDWPIGIGARVAFGGAILAAVALLAAAAYGIRYRRAIWSGLVACLIVLTVDLAVLGAAAAAGVLTAASVLPAAALSAARICFILSRLPLLLRRA